MPAPEGGRHSYMLPSPELYDLANDPDESYDVAAENPQVVAGIQAQIAAMLSSFPEPVQKAWEEQQSRKGNSSTPAGAYPRPAARSRFSRPPSFRSRFCTRSNKRYGPIAIVFCPIRQFRAMIYRKG